MDEETVKMVLRIIECDSPVVNAPEEGRLLRIALRQRVGKYMASQMIAEAEDAIRDSVGES